MPHGRMAAADEVFVLIDAASTKCGCTSSVTFGDSFSGSNCHPLASLAGQSCVGVVNQIKDLDNTASRRSLLALYFSPPGIYFLTTAGISSTGIISGSVSGPISPFIASSIVAERVSPSTASP